MASTRRRVVQTEDLSNVEFETSEDVEVIPTFDAIGLREDLLRGIYAYGFEKPSAIQQRSIKPVIKGRDVIAQAQSGTGKTATFSIGVLQTIDTQMRETQALILSPTRELAGQIQKMQECNANVFGQHRTMPSLREPNTGRSLRNHCLFKSNIPSLRKKSQKPLSLQEQHSFFKEEVSETIVSSRATFLL
ncbi:hypothetical protein ISCGN_030110 [Ixodes scapularis]